MGRSSGYHSPPFVATSELDARFLRMGARCSALWSLTVAAMIPALVGSVRRSDGSWTEVGFVLLCLALGSTPGPQFAAAFDSVLQTKTLIMATAAVAGACWALAATGLPWPMLALVSLLGASAASTFAFDTAHYWSALAGDRSRGPDTVSIAALSAVVGAIFGTVVTVAIGARFIEAAAAVSMALLCLGALFAPSLRYNPFA